MLMMKFRFEFVHEQAKASKSIISRKVKLFKNFSVIKKKRSFSQSEIDRLSGKGARSAN